MARTKDFDEHEVLVKAMNLFWLKGYNATSMQDLVDGLGISRSSLYDTFGDKHSLFIKALEHYKLTANSQLCNVVQNATSSKEALHKILLKFTDELTGDKEQKGCFMVNASVEMAPGDKVVGQMLCDNDRQMEDFFYEIIQKGQAKGEFTKQKDPRQLARFLLNTVAGLRVAGKSSPDVVAFNDIIELTLSVLD